MVRSWSLKGDIDGVLARRGKYRRVVLAIQVEDEED